MTGICLGYTTFPNKDLATKFAKILVENKLAACANLLPEVTSIYNWENQLNEDTECVLILKTRDELKTKIEEKLQETHPYQCPCLIFLPISSGLPPYLDWIRNETSP